MYDEIGYGTVFQTIIADDYSGNTAKYVIISTLSYLYDFDFLGLDVGDIQVFYDAGSYSLDNNYFEFCQVENINIEAFTNKNGCTGKAEINWFINDSSVKPVNKFEDIISIDINELKLSNTVGVVANFNNTKFGDTISFNIQKTVANTEIHNPTCSNSADGIIELDPSVVQAIWGHSDSDALYLNNLEAGTYYVSYIIPNEYSYCEFYDTITLVHENILDFTISDTNIDLSKNETLTIKNLSNHDGDFLWQIGDSTFIDNTSEFKYAFRNPGNYEIKLTDNSSICNDVMYKNILVEGDIPVLDTIPPTFTIYFN